MSEFFYDGIWRMDWGLGNPNKTAALIAILMIAAWGLVFIRKWGFWLALTLFTCLGICLVHTFSRGGIIALFAGMFPLIAYAKRPWPRNRMIAVGVSVWVILGSTVFLNAHQRYGQGISQEDRSISNRVVLWKAAPRMMVDAPSGWGLGNSGKAYMEWYQPLNRTESYRTLVNSHLTWLVEFGWGLRWLYVGLWGCALLLCWPQRRLRWPAIVLGMWIAFATSAFFSSVAESGWIWAPPVIGLALVLLYRVRHKIWPNKKCWWIPIGTATVIVGVCFLSGQSDSPIKTGQDRVVINDGAKEVIWITTDAKVLGSSCGRKLRAYLTQNKTPVTIVLAQPTAKLDGAPIASLVITGTATLNEELLQKINEVRSVILLNAAVSPDELHLTGENKRKFHVVMGEFTQTALPSIWEDKLSVQRIEGKGDYLPDWPQIILNTTYEAE